MPTAPTSDTHGLQTQRLNHKPFIQRSQFSEVPSAPVGSEIAKPNETPVQNPGVLLVLSLLVSILFLLKLLGLLSENRSGAKHEAPFSPCQTAPCPSCRFFSRNAYLKCAVRPCDVLTDRAIDCSDYCSNLTEPTDSPTSSKQNLDG